MSKTSDHMFLNVVDVRFTHPYKTILFRRESFKSSVLYDGGFTYSWNLNTSQRGIGIHQGTGVFANPAYADKSEEEICLLCVIENPVTLEDVQRYIDTHCRVAQPEFKDTLWKIFEGTNR